MNNCTFCAIVSGKTSARIIATTDDAIAFLDPTPTSVGHTLVIPKKHVENIFDCDGATWRATCDLAKAVADTMRREELADGVNILNASGSSAQQSTGHLHLHVVPRREDDGLDTWMHREKQH